MQRPPATINVLSKAAKVIRACHRLGGGVSLGDLARETKLPRSTVQRIVQTLAAERFLVSSGKASTIHLGPELLSMGADMTLDIADRTHPILQQLARDTGETVDLSRLNRNHAVFVDQVPGSHRLQAMSSVGQTFPLHCTANGKAMLASLSDERLRQILMRPLQAYTPKTIQDAIVLRKELANIRATGISTDNEEHTLGISAVGMAFVAPTLQVYAVSIPVPTVRFRDVRNACEHSLQQAIRQITSSD